MGQRIAVLLAGGESRRMKSSTSKVLHSILGWPVIRFVVEAARGAHVDTLVIVGNAKNQAPLRQAFPDESILICRQEQALGTGDAVRTGLQALAQAEIELSDAQVLVMCADAPLLKPETVQRFCAEHEASKAIVSVLSGEVDKPTGYGRIVRGAEGFERIVEEKDGDDFIRQLREINSGCLAFRGANINALLAAIEPSPSGEYYLTSAIDIARQQMLGIHAWSGVSEEEVLGINTRAQLAKATGILRQRIVNGHLENGVTFVDPSSAFIGPEVKIEPDVCIQPWVHIEGPLVLESHCSVGPFTRLRGAGRIGAGAQIGNFVEIVRSSVGAESRVLHHAYIGDTELGQDVNIGAGTVFANWDGERKHSGRVGDGAFVGSGTVVVQPAKVGAAAKPGAGSVGTHDIPAGETWLGVPARFHAKRKGN